MADRPPYPGIPRWVKVSGIIVIVLVLLIVIIMFTGVGGKHGPGRHMGVGGEYGPSRHMVSTALVATYRPVTLVATHRPVPGGDIPPEAEPVRARFESYTMKQAAREGYVPVSTPACRVRPEARLGMGPAGEGLR